MDYLRYNDRTGEMGPRASLAPVQRPETEQTAEPARRADRKKEWIKSINNKHY